MTEKWVAVHCGTKRDIERGRDFYRIGPEMDVSDPDCSCPTIPQKWRANQIVDGINATLATKDAEIERLENEKADLLGSLTALYDLVSDGGTIDPHDEPTKIALTNAAVLIALETIPDPTCGRPVEVKP